MDALLQTPNAGVKELYEAITDDPKILEYVDKDAVFVETPLHKAVQHGNTEVALEILQLMPSQGRKLNPQGYSPLHMALLKNDQVMVRAMINLDPQLIRVPGREQMTPLHCAAQEDRDEILRAFLSRRPDSINDLTVWGETAVHVAVKNRSLKALKCLLRWVCSEDKEEVLEVQDWEGKSVSDLVHETHQTEQVSQLLGCFSKPSRGCIELEVFLLSLFDPRTALGMSSETRNVILVVAVLIATATFQAILSPPGGFSNDNPLPITSMAGNNATTIFNGNKDGLLRMSRNDFSGFAAMNSIAFGFSLTVILWVVPLSSANCILNLCVICFMLAYVLAFKITSPNRHFSIAICVLLPIYCLGVGFAKIQREYEIHEENWLKFVHDVTWEPYSKEDEATMVEV